MLFLRVSEKRKLSSNTTPIRDRNDSSVASRTSMPPMLTDPSCTS
jgi:hypothetical protein